MKKLSLFVPLILALTAAAHAQFEGIGWDGDNSELVGRIGLGGYNHIEAGASFFYNNDADGDAKANVTASGRFLLALHSWEKLTGYLHAGAYFRDDSPGTTKGSFSARIGYQPEVVLLPHLAVSMLFGANIQLVPDFVFATVGNRISIVDGLNFRILF
ncbi:MAG TPA: hypothetical protein VJ385_23175 [Fibrobacteria bacterium]|nr:hypothetical protein [Fibrobacteria bacterium]